LNHATAVTESGVEIESTLARNALDGLATSGSVATAKLNATSRDVTGRPSCQRAPGASVNVTASESGAHAQRDARRGRNPPSPNVPSESPTSARRSNT
jgi:hypothetical protein